MNTKSKTKESKANIEQRYKQELIEHILAANNGASLEQTLNNLLTSAEFADISRRLQIFKLLESGMPQRQIAETLGVGIATVTRGSRALKERSL